MRLWPRRHGTSYDLLVAGLGNPGREYAHNRHNVGWLVVDELARRHDGAWKSKFNGKLAEIRIDGHRVALPDGVTLLDDGDTVFVAVTQPTREVEPEPEEGAEGEEGVEGEAAEGEEPTAEGDGEAASGSDAESAPEE